MCGRMRGACGLQDTWLVAPEKENPRAHMAISALSRALHKTKKACIIRFVPRANQAVFVGCATPLLGDQEKPDCLVLNYLPFTGLMLNSLACYMYSTDALVFHQYAIQWWTMTGVVLRLAHCVHCDAHIDFAVVCRSSS